MEKRQVWEEGKDVRFGTKAQYALFFFHTGFPKQLHIVLIEQALQTLQVDRGMGPEGGKDVYKGPKANGAS